MVRLPTVVVFWSTGNTLPQWPISCIKLMVFVGMPNHRTKWTSVQSKSAPIEWIPNGIQDDFLVCQDKIEISFEDRHVHKNWFQFGKAKVFCPQRDFPLLRRSFELKKEIFVLSFFEYIMFKGYCFLKVDTKKLSNCICTQIYILKSSRSHKRQRTKYRVQVLFQMGFRGILCTLYSVLCTILLRNPL